MHDSRLMGHTHLAAAALFLALREQLRLDVGPHGHCKVRPFLTACERLLGRQAEGGSQPSKMTPKAV